MKFKSSDKGRDRKEEKSGEEERSEGWHVLMALSLTGRDHPRQDPQCCQGAPGKAAGMAAGTLIIVCW